MKIRNIRIAALVLCLTYASTQCAITATAAETIKIGSVLSLTGPAGYLGEPSRNVLEHYVNDLNAHGGVLGRKLELVIYDDGAQAEKSVTMTKRLIESDQVDVLIGGNTTGVTMAAIPIVERSGIPFVSLAGGITIVEPVKKWVFKPSFTDRMAAEKIFNDMKKRGITKVALLSEDAGFGKSGREQSLNIAASHGIDIVASRFRPRAQHPAML